MIKKILTIDTELFNWTCVYARKQSSMKFTTYVIEQMPELPTILFKCGKKNECAFLRTLFAISSEGRCCTASNARYFELPIIQLNAVHFFRQNLHFCNEPLKKFALFQWSFGENLVFFTILWTISYFLCHHLADFMFSLRSLGDFIFFLRFFLRIFHFLCNSWQIPLILHDSLTKFAFSQWSFDNIRIFSTITWWNLFFFLQFSN